MDAGALIPGRALNAVIKGVNASIIVPSVLTVLSPNNAGCLTCFEPSDISLLLIFTPLLVSKLISSFDDKFIDLFELNIISSSLELSIILLEFTIIWGFLYSDGLIILYVKKTFSLAKPNVFNCWVDVNHIED